MSERRNVIVSYGLSLLLATVQGRAGAYLPSIGLGIRLVEQTGTKQKDEREFHQVMLFEAKKNAQHRTAAGGSCSGMRQETEREARSASADADAMRARRSAGFGAWSLAYDAGMQKAVSLRHAGAWGA